jgi:predicted RNase H-like nuclease (RuvC/YqgF family)
MPSDRNTTLSGFIVGYDPGAEKAHGFALLSVEDGVIVRVTMDTLSSTEEVIRQIEQLPDFWLLASIH